MNKLSYLKLAFEANLFSKKWWLVSILGMIVPMKKETYLPYEIMKDEWGYSYWDPEGGLGPHETMTGPDGYTQPMQKVIPAFVKIQDADPSLPLFSVHDRILIDSTWMTSVSEPMDVKFGNFLYNAICIYPTFGHRIPFIAGSTTVRALEDKVAPILKDTPKPGIKREGVDIYCDDWVKFLDSREHLKSIAYLLNQSATVKTITKSPDFEAFKKKLEKEYEGRLTDPVILVEFEKKLQEFDNEWLKGDPTDKTFLTGKIRNVARKKMHISIGAEPGFENKSTVIPITKSLDNGWPTDPDQHVSVMNGIRFGSLSRGKETVKGGVTAKYLLRAGNNFSIVNGDCGSKNGLRLTYDNASIQRLVGRSIIVKNNGEHQLVETLDMAKSYIGKEVVTRSPAFCRSEGDRICTVCAGVGLSLNPTGVSIGLTEMSAIIMNDFMKGMHDTTIKTEKLDIAEIFS